MHEPHCPDAHPEQLLPCELPPLNLAENIDTTRETSAEPHFGQVASLARLMVVSISKRSLHGAQVNSYIGMFASHCGFFSSEGPLGPLLPPPLPDPFPFLPPLRLDLDRFPEPPLRWPCPLPRFWFGSPPSVFGLSG